MYSQNFSQNGDLFITKDKALRLKIKRQLQMNQVIKESIQQNTFNILNQRNQSEYVKELIKPNSLYDNLVDESNMHVVNQMPFLLFGLVKTVFLEDKTGQQQIIYGCGILIDSNVILIPAQNLIYDDNDAQPEEEEEEEEDEDKKEENKNNEKEKKEKSSYSFFKIEFQPLNLSPEYRSYFPRSIKVIDHYTPMNQNENIYKPDSNLQDEEAKTDFNKIEEKTVKNDVDKISNAWGIGYLEYPVGDIINYIYKKTKINPTKMNKYVIKRNKNKINFEDESIFDKLKIDNLSEEELAKTDFIFLECFARSNEDLSEGDEEDTGNNNENQEKNNNNNQNPINQEKEESKNNIENKENTKDNNNNKNNSEKKSNENDAQNNESKKEEENNNNEENAESEESTALSDQQNLTLPYQYFESQYLMEFDQKFIYLKNIYQIEELDKNILPGFIIGKYMNKFHILGMNTSNIIEIKNNGEENNENADNNKNEENKNNENNDNDKSKEQNQKEKEGENDKENQNQENNENKEDNANKDNNNNNEATNNENQESNVEYIHQAIRFTKHLSSFINAKVQELNNQNSREFNFNERIFSLLDSKITSKEFFMNLLKDNCVGLYKFLNDLRSEKSLTNDDKLVLNITNEENLKFIQFCLMIIYNKLTSSILDCQKINFNNLKIGFFPGSSILSEIIQSQSEIMIINLKNNDIYSNGVKEIMNPIFNQKKIFSIGKNLNCLCLDGNKLDGKSMKYIRHLIKVSSQLKLINFSNNFIKGSSLRHLLNCTKNKDNMSILHLNNNLLGENCGDNLSGILTNLTQLKELNLSCNCLGDKPIPLILNPLKKNASIEILYLSCNDIGPKSGTYLANFLSNNKNLKILTLNNNPLTASGIKSISQALNTKLVLEEINLNSTSAGDEGGAELFENMKLNKSLRRVYANNNKFYKNSMFNFGELLKKDNDDPNSEGGLEFLSLSYNEIDDECVGFFSQDLTNYKWLREIKLNNNRITEKGGQEILFAVLQNDNINEVNLENNNAEWGFSNEDFKHYRDNINIYL